jgi:hypothetical protein
MRDRLSNAKVAGEKATELSRSVVVGGFGLAFFLLGVCVYGALPFWQQFPGVKPAWQVRCD